MNFTDVATQMTNNRVCWKLLNCRASLTVDRFHSGHAGRDINKSADKLPATAGNVEIGTILKAFNYPISLTGKCHWLVISPVLT